MQGLLELANVPYVGAGVLGLGGRHGQGGDEGAVRRARPAGLPVARRSCRAEWDRDRDRGRCSALDDAGPAGVRQAGQPRLERRHLEGEDARRARRRRSSWRSQFDRKVVVEAAVPNAREIECAVLGNDDPEASVPGEIMPSREFYDYEAKYLDAGSQTVIPADADRGAGRARCSGWRSRRSARSTRAGMARVDFLLSRDSGEIYVNEINTMPGFTTISMYPKMWEASGLAYAALRRSADSARARAPRRKAAARNERAVSATARCGCDGACVPGACASVPAACVPSAVATPQPGITAAPAIARAYDLHPRRRFRRAEDRRCRRPVRRRRWWRAAASRRSACGGRSSSIPTAAALDAAFLAAVERGDRRSRAHGPPRAGARRGVVLSRRRLRRARAVPRLARRAARRRPRRQADQGSARAGAGARSVDARRGVRHRHVSLLRRRRAGGLQVPALAAAAARRRSRRRPRAARTRRQLGLLVRGEAQYQIQVLYLWYEHKSKEALAIVRGLQARYPHNPLFRQIEAEILDEYFHDHAAQPEGVGTTAGARAIARGVSRRHRRTRRARATSRSSRARCNDRRKRDYAGY